MGIDFDFVNLHKPADANVILGQAHFVKTVEDLFEVIAGTGPHLRFGIAFCEASGARLIRHSGNDQELQASACRAAEQIGAGHSFVVMLRGGYPVSVLNAVKAVPEVCGIWCATANPIGVVVATVQGARGVAAVLDGGTPLGIESDADAAERHTLLRELGYKL
ncbi:adenosine-specific kinase [Actinoplanes oblitus]|uniref:Adenosine-specific kinase n=1 Tax=Actinoplanes oblitus TaxID=3040509 RepID=A0ABY8W785_9ACTN|nr:adenosine-specific kinase [Actinoplanes oblitus]WIM92877.1 adenosine-specific kinase [Actinoplanes oblitus]